MAKKIASEKVNLLKEHIASSTEPQERQVFYVQLISAVPSKPVEVNGVPKAKLCILVASEDGELAQFFPFADSVWGMPTFIPEGGIAAQITLQPFEDKDGKRRIGCVGVGVEAE